jgi:cystathionine beta-lyase/cystathionine gamma-synthase
MPESRLGSSSPLAPPIYPSSVYRLPDLDALDRIYSGGEPGFIYARDGHPNAASLAAKLAVLESASWAVVCSSGMGALSTACLALLAAGDHVVASDRLYGRTSQLLKQELTRFGVEVQFVDVNNLDAVRNALAKPARLLIAETISNPLLRVSDIPALASAAHDRDCRLLIDNTFATPVLCRPLELGADLVMESLTKMIGGHSDVTLGMLAGNDPEVGKAAALKASVWGFVPSPHECWLTERSLSTLRLRMTAATANAAALADWLASHPSVQRVVYPARPDHPDHGLARRLLSDGSGCMVGFELKGLGRDVVNRFMRRAAGIAFCPSLGDVATTCSHPATTSHRYETAEEKARQGIVDGLIRLSVGIEPLEQIRLEIAKGLLSEA